MSAATQTALGDPTRATPAFSYAQAAKGRSPSGPPSVSMEKAPKGDQDTRSVNPSTADNQDTALAAGSFSTKRAASEGHRSRNSSTTVTAETIPPFQGNTESSTTEPATTPATQASEQSQVAVSTPSSPEFGITSTSTIPKDDDLFSNANASSDSTWEKLSQGSQNGSKSNEKIDTEKEPTVSGSWDADTPALPVPPALKEAPPPTVNIWKQRIDAKAAKQPASTSSSNPSSQMTATDNVNRASKPFDIGAESRKHDNKKQVKRAQGGNDDKPATAGAKDAMKPMDGKGNAAEASEPGQPKHLRAANVDRSVPGSIAPPPPPPAGDAQSWPTPDSAVDEERRKAQERAEKGDKDKSTMTKSHGKEKWMPVPYVPSYVPSTPLPNIRRGARAPRGGRDSLPRGGGFSTDKATAGSPEATAGSQPVVSERGKPDSATTRSSSGTMRPKRASSAGPPATRDQRRGSDMTAPERRKDIGKSNMPAESRRASSITQDEEPRSRRGPTDPNEVDSQSGAAKVSQEPSGIPSRNDGAGDSHAHPKVNGFERRGEGGPRTYEYARDYHNVAPARERGEGRPERGRGGYRSRGAGNHTFTHAAIPNSHIGQHPYAPPPMPGKSSSFHDRHASQYQNSTYQPRQTQGRFRSGSQSYSVPHTATNTRFPQGQHTHQLPNLQTDVANAWGFQPGSQGIMSANPYNPYMEQVSIVGMVSMQMEYYFSVDNLCKDMYLRRHMDSQGFVFLSVLAKFNRIRQLTQDLELLRYVCVHAPQIEFRVGSDGYDRLRKREGWQQWILAMEERDPSVQNDGPSQVQEPALQQQPFYEAPYSLEPQQIISPRTESTNLHQILDAATLPYGSTSPSRPIINGSMNGGMDPQISLPTAGSDVTSGMSMLDNTDKTFADRHLPAESTFTDEQVDLLMIVVRKPLNHSMQAPPPFHSAASRTFSNGSIDARTMNDELAKFNECEKFASINGDNSSDVKAPRARSPFPVGSPSRRGNTVVSPPVFWVKDKDTPIDSLPENLTHEPYNIFRRNALMQRETTRGSTCHYDMDILYQFWSHFLIRNFNARMYQEFRQTAFEDAEKNDSNVGLKNLIQYYNESILSQKTVSDQIANDLLSFVQSEDSGKERPAFGILRAAWRNGAFNLKNRKKLDGIIDPSTKAELER